MWDGHPFRSSKLLQVAFNYCIYKQTWAHCYVIIGNSSTPVQIVFLTENRGGHCKVIEMAALHLASLNGFNRSRLLSERQGEWLAALPKKSPLRFSMASEASIKILSEYRLGILLWGLEEMLFYF